MDSFSGFSRFNDQCDSKHKPIRNAFMLKHQLCFITLLAMLITTFTASTQADENPFPGRTKYPHTPFISTEQLFKEYDQVIIVDARSSFEFQTLRIASAYNVSLGQSTTAFIKKIRALRDENPNKKIIFYCNGHTCMKSYKATLKAKNIVKVKNIFAYDAGIFDWTRAHPDKAILLGQTPVNPDDLITSEKLKSHMLNGIDFIQKATDKTIIVDVRSRDQREGFYIFSGFENKIPLSDSENLKKIIKKAKRKKKDLYIYDAVGKQVRWLQYFLEKENAGNYYFMKGGANAYYDIPIAELLDH